LLEIGEARVEKGALLGRDGDVLFGERIPQRLDQLKAIAGAELQRVCEEVGVHVRKYSAMRSPAPRTRPSRQGQARNAANAQAERPASAGPFKPVVSHLTLHATSLDFLRTLFVQGVPSEAKDVLPVELDGRQQRIRRRTFQKFPVQNDQLFDRLQSGAQLTECRCGTRETSLVIVGDAPIDVVFDASYRAVQFTELSVDDGRREVAGDEGRMLLNFEEEASQRHAVVVGLRLAPDPDCRCLNEGRKHPLSE
jgi:hypothetical protein